ncbi:hypothetical protein BG006_008172 [Podila minutissima]|uniref:NodB homology domain-containing protein n=1 Tax=Podila minutissima TaxID=64525 RepID=A0A9P5SGV4_9FUNG|nr:hypothetical protein BG006_008172 [Podila minutissima]
MRFITISVAAATVLLLSGLSGSDAAIASTCDTTKCVFPACVCPSEKPPKGMDPKTVPQFFTLTFDDAIQAATVPVASALMSQHRNPNGCPMKATWFAQTLYSDYALIQQWYAAGNEVADHTMNHIGTPPVEEIVGNRKAINAFSGIPFAKMTGFRAPFLNYSKSTFDILAQEKIQYDSSVNAIPTDAYWPYTLDNGVANDCWNGICAQPIVSPGLWEIPMHAITNSDQPTAKVISMDPQLEGTGEVVGGWLKNNFNRHYNGNRQPFGIYLHPVHVGQSVQMFNDFFKWAAAQPDVWFVTNQQLLEWMKNPVPASQLAAQDYMKCNIPAVGKEICNGMDDTKAGAIDSKVLETCNFASGPWSTCYGCPKTIPTPADPVPERVVAAGQASYRTPVPANCAMEWWDPVAAQCLCTSSNCTFTDVSQIKPTTTSTGTTSPTGNPNKNNAGQLTGSLATLSAIAAVAAGIAQLL